MSASNCIYSYSRAQGIEDGVLIEVSDTANKLGLKVHVAITDTLYHQFIEPSSALEAEGQTPNGRFRDVLMMLIVASKWSKADVHEAHFKVSFLMTPKKRETVDLWAVIDGGDDGQPVITIMLEGED